MIDPHVHLRDWEQSSKETILHGMTVASRLGFTHLFDMPNTSPACTDRDTILARLADGGEAAEGAADGEATGESDAEDTESGTETAPADDGQDAA